MPALQKKILRLEMKERRVLLFQRHPHAGEEISTLFFKFFELSPSAIVGGYWPIGSELDIRPLLHKLIDKNFQCALPCIDTNGITFRLWTPLTPLEKGPFHTFEPALTSPVVFPDILLVPLLAYDKNRHRLGYGQGHYDRYLHHHKTKTIGVGFKDQEVEKVPHQSHDFVLDAILTEKGVEA